MKSSRIITTSWDDGHLLDIKLAALLKKYNIKGTFYVTPKHNELVNQLLTKDEIMRLSEDFEIGAHTIYHSLLTELTQEMLTKELSDSKIFLEELLKKPIKMFCYPRGLYNENVKAAVKKADFIGARTIETLNIDYPNDFFEFGTTIHAFPATNIFNNVKESLKNNIKFLPFMLTGDWKKIAKETFSYVNKNGGVWHLWGHSWEIEKFNLWGDLEELLIFIANKKDFNYLTNSEVLESKI